MVVTKLGMSTSQLLIHIGIHVTSWQVFNMIFTLIFTVELIMRFCVAGRHGLRCCTALATCSYWKICIIKDGPTGLPRLLSATRQFFSRHW